MKSDRDPATGYRPSRILPLVAAGIAAAFGAAPRPCVTPASPPAIAPVKQLVSADSAAASYGDVATDGESAAQAVVRSSDAAPVSTPRAFGHVDRTLSLLHVQAATADAVLPAAVLRDQDDASSLPAAPSIANDRATGALMGDSTDLPPPPGA